MKVLLDENGFVKSFAIIGDLIDSVEVPDPDDLNHFTDHFGAYKVSDSKISFDEEYEKALHSEAEKENLRTRREKECFSVINRGQLWCEGISIAQMLELRQWYKAWLNVTETMVVPDKPSWLT